MNYKQFKKLRLIGSGLECECRKHSKNKVIKLYKSKEGLFRHMEYMTACNNAGIDIPTLHEINRLSGRKTKDVYSWYMIVEYVPQTLFTAICKNYMSNNDADDICEMYKRKMRKIFPKVKYFDLHQDNIGVRTDHSFVILDFGFWKEGMI